MSDLRDEWGRRELPRECYEPYPTHERNCIVLLPEKLKIEVGLDEPTRSLVDRALALSEGKFQKQIDALAAEIAALGGKAAAALEKSEAVESKLVAGAPAQP